MASWPGAMPLPRGSGYPGTGARMNVLTLTQPWATLIAVGAKRIETRSWKTHLRGPIAIHAAKTFPAHAKSFCESRLVCRALGWPECPATLTQEWLDDNARHIRSLPLGAVLATARLVHCLETETIRSHVQPFTAEEELFGDYSRGRFGFLLDEVVMLPAPIPAKGALGFWKWDDPGRKKEHHDYR